MESSPVPTRHPPKPRARNSLLKQYYGLKDKASATPTIQIEQENSKPFDLDSKTFNSSKYFASLLKEKTLQGLVQEDNRLVGEIREINGDMKTLVYENYNKFISATDTIRKMKSNVESMESEMSRLNENIAGITTKSKFINEELGPNRQKIQQLSNVHNSLKQLQFIFELPNRLQLCLNKGKYSQAVKYYSKASRMLNHYKHMAAFKGIERDCHCIMEKIKAEIVENMTSQNATSQKIAEETKLLLLLGEDTHQLWKQYINIQLNTLKKKQTEKAEPSDVKELITIYITPLENIVHHFETLFLVESEQDDTNSVTNLDIKEKEVAKSDLLEAVNPYLDKIFELAADFIELPINISLEQPLKQADALNELKSALNNNTVSLTTVTNVDDRTAKLTSDWENALINGLLDSTIGGLRDRLSAFIGSLQENNEFDNDKIGEFILQENNEFDNDKIGEFIQDTQTWIINHLINTCLLPLKGCLDITNTETLTRIQNGTKAIWQKLASKFEDIHKTSKLNKTSVRILMLVGSRLCYDLADNGIFYLYQAFSSEFYKQKSASYEAEANIDPHVIPDMNEIIDTYLKTGQDLVNKQMIQEGYCLSSRIQEAYLLSPIITTVDQVSTIWHDVYNRLKYTERLVEALYPSTQSRNSLETSSQSEYDYGSGEPYSSRHVLPSTHSLATVSSETTSKQQFGGNDMMMNNIDKLFAERVDIYRKVDPTPIGVCTGLVLIILKSFLEVVREIQMDRVHYQQVQVDIEYVKRIIWPYAGEEKWAATMLQEILTSIYTRCASPVNLSQEELAQILDRK